MNHAQLACINIYSKNIQCTLFVVGRCLQSFHIFYSIITYHVQYVWALHTKYGLCTICMDNIQEACTANMNQITDIDCNDIQKCFVSNKSVVC